MKTLSKQHMALVHFASGDPVRPVLTGIYVDPDTGMAAAADGFKLLEMPLSEVPDGDYPPTPGAGSEPIGTTVIPAVAVAAAIKSLPKKSLLPCLDHVKLSGNGKGKVTLTTYDLETARDSSVDAVKVTYPNYPQLIPAHAARDESGEPRVFALALPQLEALVKAMKNLKAEAARFQVTKWDAAIRVEIKYSDAASNDQTAVAVVMPYFAKE